MHATKGIFTPLCKIIFWFHCHNKESLHSFLKRSKHTGVGLNVHVSQQPRFILTVTHKDVGLKVCVNPHRPVLVVNFIQPIATLSHFNLHAAPVKIVWKGRNSTDEHCVYVCMCVCVGGGRKRVALCVVGGIILQL